jgi:purine-binding chemotaxis protein CheW
VAAEYVVFKLGNEEYGMDISAVNAIENMDGVTRIPNAPKYILGIINLRGTVVPVYSLRIKFGMPEKDIDEKTQMIIAHSYDQAGELVGYKADAVSGIMEFQDDEISEIPVIVKNDRTAYAKKVAKRDGRLIILLDQNGMLTDSEKKAIEKITNN